MKLKDKIIYSCLAASLLAGAIGVGVSMANSSEPLEVDAASPNTYIIYGDLANYPTESWNGAGGLTFEETADCFELKVAFEVGDKFKVVRNGAEWLNTTAFNDEGGELLFGRTADNDKNFECKVPGLYRVTLNLGIDSWGDWSYNENSDYLKYSPYNFEFLGTGEKTEVTFYGPDGDLLKTEEATLGLEYTPSWFLIDGYRGVQWYTNEERTELYEPTVLTGPLVLYGKGEVAGEDTVIYYEGDYSYVHYWNDVNGGGTEWPGVQMEEVVRHWASDDMVYKAVIPAEYDATYVIFNNGSGGEGNQTADFPLMANSVYNNDGDDPLSVQKIASLDFLAYFDSLRDEKGDICALRDDKEKLETLFGLYDALGKNTALVDGLEDLGAYIYGEDDILVPTEVTVGETMNYLALYLTPAVSESAKVGSGNDGTAWIAVSILVGAAAAMGAGLYLAKKRKAAK